MSAASSARRFGKRILGYKAADLVRRSMGKSAPQVAAYRARLSGKRALEIGGPSETFGDEGGLPLYAVLKSIDNCLFSSRNIWSGEIKGCSFHYHPQKKPGHQYVCEATDLTPIPDSSYEIVLASHCLEHIANPLRALEEWKRVLTKDGFMLLILPHKDGTFDWRRPVTPLEHVIHDYETGVEEDDLTHLSEVLSLHDLTKDAAAGSDEQFKQRCLENRVHRAMHHHVFTTMSAVMMVDHSGFQLIDITPTQPISIVILARKCSARPDNSKFMHQNARSYRRSPFPSDHPRR